ncbi:MAG: hypothetical protein IJD57_07260 [Candidatus Gastranaerophilales bacterium]|nr:hypothetical protein [Candidatus Gastranaerophilales bacterium]
MKKSLIIFLSLVFMSLSAHAVGVDCWEEADVTYLPETTSKMKSILGDKIEIVRVSTRLEALSTAIGSIKLYLPKSADSYKATADGKDYYLLAQPYTSITQNGLFSEALYNSGVVYRNTGTTDALTVKKYTGSSYSSYYAPIQYYTRTTSINEGMMLTMFHSFIHTYCIANTNSGGGGGGAAGAAVNYIIKAD